MARRYSFPKSDRLFLQKEIDLLFNKGKSFVAFPLRVIYVLHQPAAESSNLAALISVPKKKIRSAVGRNRIKRLIRESYRLNKPDFADSVKAQNHYLLIGFLYLGDRIPTYKEIDNAVLKALTRLTNELK